MLLGPDVVGLVAGLEPLTREVIEASALRVISRCGAGTSNVDIQAARALGVAVHWTPDAPTAAVAELTLGAMLGLLRELPQMSEDLHKGVWTKRIGCELRGKTVVIVGYGRIGRRVGQLVEAFGARVVAVDPGVAGAVGLADALPQADIVTLHNSGQDEVLGAAQLERLRKGAYLLNCARGEAIAEEALCQALDAGRVAGAWLDCFRDEPYRGPLERYPQVLLSPHVGSYTRECRLQMESECAHNLIEALRQA